MWWYVIFVSYKRNHDALHLRNSFTHVSLNDVQLLIYNITIPTRIIYTLHVIIDVFKTTSYESYFLLFDVLFMLQSQL